jgi:peptidoglycan hydrolase-like protein with peptidoglycan-binding domain
MTDPEPTLSPETPDTGDTSSAGPRRGRRRALVIAGIAVLGVVIAAGVGLFIETQASVGSGSKALADITVPPGASVSDVSAVDLHGNPVQIVQTGTSIYPAHPMAPGTTVTVRATVHYGAPVSWALGSTRTISANIVAPTATLVTPSVQTLPTGHPVAVAFDTPVARAAVTTGGVQTTSVHTAGTTAIRIPHAGPYGTAQIAVAPRAWETLPAGVQIAWFAPGSKTEAIGTPGVGTPITPYTPLVLTFSTPVRQIPGALHTQVSPGVPGHWHIVGTHTVAFAPSGSGFPPDSRVHVTLPAHTEVAGAPSRELTWTVARPSPLRAQQLLAELGYLPVSFTPSTPVAPTQQAQVEAIFAPPTGRYTFRWRSTPALVRSTWTGNPAVMVQGAIMAFEDQHGMTTDGTLGPAVWQALVQAALARQHNTFGYTFVSVTETSPERLTLWHNGRVLMTPLVNTGIPGASTATGIYPVYLREKVGTMSGTNPDGTKYHDPGIPWISYFHGGDALHGFIRASYGSPQSLGCVEMPFATAGAVWPYTPLGTLVDIL